MKIYFSFGINKEIYSQTVYVHLNNNEIYICKVYSKSLISSNECLIDTTVSCAGKSKLSQTIFKETDIIIKEITTVAHLKKIVINIIFTNPWEKEKWGKNHFKRLVKQVLQFLIITNNSFINLYDLDVFKKLGINFIEVLDNDISGVGKVVNSTKIVINNCMSLEKYNAIKCCKSVVNVLKAQYGQIEDVLLSRTKTTSSLSFSQVLIVGPPGCGKKTLVKQFCCNNSLILQILDCSEICMPEPGETESALKRKFEYATLLTKESHVVMLLLRLEVIGCQYGRILIQLNSLLDSVMNNSFLIVIVPTSNPKSFHESLRSRFLHQIYIGPPSECERVEMFSALCSNMNLNIELLKEVAKFTPGFVISDLKLLINRIRRYISLNNDIILSKDLFKKFASIIIPNVLRGEVGLIQNNQDLEEIGGLEDIKKSLFQFIQWPLLIPHAFETFDMKPPSGILLYGPPGCAKTSLVRAAASQCNITFLAVSAADLYSPYVGDAEQLITRLFDRARAASPTLLFIDEIDALVGCRSGRQKGAQERVLSAFLTEMDGIGTRLPILGSKDITYKESLVIVVAATNRPNVLDSALLRPGRFDRLIYVPPPSSCIDRVTILKVLCKKMPLAECVNLEEIASRTELFTGADLANLCREAALEALTAEGINVEMVQKKHFINALKIMKPSLTETTVKWYVNFNFT